MGSAVTVVPSCPAPTLSLSLSLSRARGVVCVVRGLRVT